MTQTQRQNQNQGIVKLDPTDNAITAIDKLAEEYALVKADTSRQFSQAIKQANGIILLRNALTSEIMDTIMQLQGSPLGFKTDKDSAGGYPEKVVKECVIEAIMRGVHLIGNEFNILAGRCYITKEGCGTLLDKIPGLRYMITPGIPKIVSSGAEAPVKVEWRLNSGETQVRDLVFPIRVNQGMGADAINGKATRKARAWLISQITGFEIEDGEAEEGGFASPMESAKQGRFAKKAPIDVTPKAQEAEATVTVEEPFSGEAAETTEQKYPRLAQLLAERPQFDLTVQDFIDWFAASKWAFNEEHIIQQIDSACESCYGWKQTQNNG